MKTLGICLVLIVWMLLTFLLSITIIGLCVSADEDWKYIGTSLINKL
jgi:ABC-type transport system involved in multi-copper enzyme maturation permease subunit